MPETETIVTMLGLMLASAVQAGTGFGFALLAIPFLMFWHDLPTSIVIISIAGGISTTQASIRDRHYIDIPLVVTYSAAALIGMPLGVLLLQKMSADLMNAIVGVAVLMSVAALHYGHKLPGRSSTHYAAGLLSGTMMTSTGINGPPVVIALHSANLGQRAFRGSLSLIFTIHRLCALLMLWWSSLLHWEGIRLALLGLPAILIGWELGNQVFIRLDQARFKRIVEVMLVLSAIACLYRAF